MNVIARKALSIFTSLTNDYHHIIYPDADHNDKELIQKLKYILQNRTVLWLAHKTNISFKEFLAIGQLGEEKAQLALNILAHPETTPENIRDWWSKDGKMWAKEHKEQVHLKELDDKKAWVIRDDKKGLFLSLNNNTLEYHQTPKDITGYSIDAQCVCLFTLKTIFSKLSKSDNIRVFKMSRDQMKTVNTVGFTKSYVDACRAITIHVPPIHQK